MAMSSELLQMVKNTKNKYSRSSRSVKLKEGKTMIRLLGKPGEKFWAELGVHWIKTEKNGKPVAVVGCADEVKGQPCAICTAIERASKAAADDETIALIKEWKVKRTVLVNALVRSGADKSDEPQVVELTTTTFGTMLSMIEEYAASDIDILDLQTGVDFIVERKGKGLDTEYTVMPAPKSFPVDKAILDRLHNLDEYIEKEFFKGEESKALRAIGSVTGTNVDNLALAPSKAPALAGPGAIVEDAELESLEEIEEAPATAPAPAPAAAKPAAAKPAAAKPAAAPAAAPTATGASQDEIDAMLADLG